MELMDIIEERSISIGVASSLNPERATKLTDGEVTDPPKISGWWIS